jgi:Fis family transcriptional regulator
MSSIEESVRRNVQEYFKNLDGTPPAGVYDMLIRAVEKPLLEVVMAQAGHNQSKAADWLGLNRNTLRKKLDEHGMLRAPSR